MFTTYWIAPETPTSLTPREWLPLPATDYCFYPMVNSWLLPEPLDVEKLRQAVAKALQILPLNAAELSSHPTSGKWQLHLKDRPIPVRVGTSSRPGPFASNWQGEKDPDWYDELPRSGADLGQYSAAPLTKLLVTTYEKTGQTAIMLSQSYNLGDGFALGAFMKALSSFYQGKKPDFLPTYEKYLMPEPQLSLRGNYMDELKHISWLAGSFSDEFHRNRADTMDAETSRIEVDFPVGFVEHIKKRLQAATGIERLSSGDAFSGYLASTLGHKMSSKPKLLSQCVGYRGQTMQINESDVHVPFTSMGTCYIIQVFNIESNRDFSHETLAKSFHDARQDLSNKEYLGRVYALYNHLYKTATLSSHTPFDSGHEDAIAVNNVMKLRLSDADFGFTAQVGWIEWEVLENFIQFQESKPKKRADGSCRSVEGEITLVTRLKHDVVPGFLRQLTDDVRAFQSDGSITARVLRPKTQSRRAHL